MSAAQRAWLPRSLGEVMPSLFYAHPFVTQPQPDGMAWMDGCPIIVLLNHSLLKNFYFLWMMGARDEAQGAWRGRPVIQLSIYLLLRTLPNNHEHGRGGCHPSFTTGSSERGSLLDLPLS